MTIEEVFEKTDWALLRKQKMALIEADGDERLDGLLAFIDAVQDAASDAGHPVFGAEECEHGRRSIQDGVPYCKLCGADLA